MIYPRLRSGSSCCQRRPLCRTMMSLIKTRSINLRPTQRHHTLRHTILHRHVPHNLQKSVGQRPHDLFTPCEVGNGRCSPRTIPSRLLFKMPSHLCFGTSPLLIHSPLGKKRSRLHGTHSIKLLITKISTKSPTASLGIETLGNGFHLSCVPTSSFTSWYLLACLKVDARVSILRGEVRDAASAAIASFHIKDSDEAGEYLLQDLTYIYPVDPFVSSFPRFHATTVLTPA